MNYTANKQTYILDDSNDSEIMHLLTAKPRHILDLNQNVNLVFNVH